MPAQINRADKKALEKVFKEGRFINSPSLTFKFLLKTGSELPRVSFIAPKSVARLAVKRNLLRRRGYMALRESLGRLPKGIAGAFVFKKYQDDVSIIGNEITGILNKVN